MGQRGNVALSNSAVKYGACDRWGMYPNVSNTHSATSSQATVTWSESGNAIGWTAVTTVQAGQMLTRQFIESSNVRHLTGKKLTCSFKVFHDVGADVSVNILTLKPNSKDNFASTTDLTSNTMITTAASGVVTEVSYTWPNALTAADCVNGFCVTIQLGTSTSVTNKNFYVADLQLEEGSVATDFEHRSYGEILADCQRYYQKTATASGVVSTSSIVYLAVQLVTEMRAVPTWSLSHPMQINDVGVNATQSSADFTAYNSTTNGTFANLGNFSGLTAYRGCLCRQHGGGNTPYMIADAEL